MNTKRIIFWSGFVILLALIVWGLVVAMNKPVVSPEAKLGTPAPVTSADHVRGPVDAPITLVEYSDFQCPACGAYYPLVEKLMTEASTSVRLVYRHFPLTQHLNAPAAAYASEAASKQGKFWDMYHELFDNQNSWSDVSDPKSIFDGYAQKLGLNMAQFDADSVSTTTKAIVDGDLSEGTALGINGTPTFFLNGKGIVTPGSYEEFKTTVLSAATSSAN